MTKRIFITGVVQGVGFRPCCKKVADEMGLCGTVKNLGGNAEIVISASDRVSEEFLRRLVCLLPKSAVIDSVEICDAHEPIEGGFKIIESTPDRRLMPEIIPDVATCKGCLAELFDENNRRYMHPFISCTVCGPRYSVIEKLPYDRKNTLMEKFPLCENCKREYTDSLGKRLHAQTIACKECGPALSFYPEGENDPTTQAVDIIAKGGIVAVRDVGGFHFVCLAENPLAVANLRELKKRECKPFAVMFENIEKIKEYANVNEAEKELLMSSAGPIVLCEMKKNIGEGVCSNSRFIGAMLPSNPLQHILVRKLGPLVMTSGNLSGEPIITDNAAMLEIKKNNPLLDGVLYHDRDIITPLDDSIYYVTDRTPHIMRRGRGITPESLPLKGGNDTVFAAGGDLKSTFGFYKNGKAVLSQYLGDLEDEDCNKTYRLAAKHMADLYGIIPDVAVCDSHPAYFSSKKAEELFGVTPLYVQHHHAHIASVMAEHSLEEVIGIALDGTGYGDDGSVWGGEVLHCKAGEVSRLANLASVPMCGGDSISKNADEALACFCLAAGEGIPERILSRSDAELVKAAVENKINTLPSSSCGRLFDAVAAALDLGHYNRYEGECAINLENAAARAQTGGTVATKLKLDYNNYVFDTPKLIKQILELAESENADSLALGFHYALAEALVCAVGELASKKALPKRVALSGGCFANRILVLSLCEKLRKEGFEVYLNEKVPCGDSGLALGQLFIAERNK